MCIANEKEEKSINASGVVRDYEKTITLSFSIFFVRKMMDRKKKQPGHLIPSFFLVESFCLFLPIFRSIYYIESFLRPKSIVLRAGYVGWDIIKLSTKR